MMKVTGQSIDYIHNLHSGKHNEKTENYSEFMEKGTDSHKDFEMPGNGSCPVNEIYESMSQGGIIKSFTSIGVYNMGYDTSLYLSDAGNLTCLDDKERGKVLWEIPIKKDDYPEIEELMKRGQDYILRDKNIVEEYLKGTINIEDIQRLQDHSVYDDFFGNCSEDVKKAWEDIQGTNELGSINRNLDKKNYFLTEIDKYVLMYLTDNVRKFDGSLESTISFVEDVTNSIKDSLNLYSSKMQEKKLKELDVLERFKEELVKLK